jgi:hypothetical protein
VSFFYVSLDGVSEETLEMLGYYKLDESDQFAVYYHKGEEIIVEKADPFIYIDDINDAPYFGSEIVSVTREE